ncbi:hypothetical protein [Rhizobium sp.]|uniref:hypothetical protein n=1 Tax=Rhizobium sp. TaxID=391 RepID=UPI003F81F49B
MTIDPRVSTLCAEYRIRIVDGRSYPGIRETRAVFTMDKILRLKGEEHFRMVLSTVAETENNSAYLDKFLFWAVSDLVDTFQELVETRTSEWLVVFDGAPVGELQYIARRLKHQRFALVGMLTERVVKHFGPTFDAPVRTEPKVQSTIPLLPGQYDLFEEKRTAA